MFSVIIPVYNSERTIERVLDSVKKQTRLDMIEEIIIINDGSPDNSKEVIRKYMEQNRELPIFYCEQENHGVSYTRNRGIKMAKAEWIALLDADDIWKENKLERQYEVIKSVPEISFLGSLYPLKILMGKKQGIYKLNAYELCIRNMPSTPSVVFKRKVGISLGLFNERQKYCEDINFFQKFLLKDSYYILAEDLIEISIDKEYFAQSGLSADLYNMHKGRNRNTRELQQMKLIGKFYMYLMLSCNWLKFLRRYLQQKIRKAKSHK